MQSECIQSVPCSVPMCSILFLAALLLGTSLSIILLPLWGSRWRSSRAWTKPVDTQQNSSQMTSRKATTLRNKLYMVIWYYTPCD